MEEIVERWLDIDKQIKDSIDFLDDYFTKEHPDDKTAYYAYYILRNCAKTFINLGNRLANSDE